MVEVFNYTERVVNMVRPRKLLFMAIGTSSIRSSVLSYALMSTPLKTVWLLVPR